MSTETPTITATSRVTWCLTANRYAAPDVHCIPGKDHDHYDVALTESGQVAWRYYPVGTTFRTSDGYTMRLSGYTRQFADMEAMEKAGLEPRDAPVRPRWDGVAPSGGAFGDSEWLPGDDATIIVYSLFEDVRPAVGSLFVRPNGEAWRIRSYRIDWNDESDFSNKQPSFSVNLPHGASTNGDVLPSDARLVWHP